MSSEIEYNYIPITDTFASLCLSSKVQPAVQSEIDALSTVEAKIETGMVSTWKCDNELSSLLYQYIRSAGRLSESRWGCQEGLVTKELGTV